MSDVTRLILKCRSGDVISIGEHTDILIRKVTDKKVELLVQTKTEKRVIKNGLPNAHKERRQEST